jgi:ribosomal protein S18 acetylase RimI-like enzyme
MIIIRRLQSGEVNLFKQLRLSSLQDAPYAFSSTYDSAVQRSAESWREQAESTTQGSDRATFIAFSNNMPIAITALYRLDGQAGVGEVLQVWVDPEYRGMGVAWKMMDAVLEWARKNNFSRIKAGVTKVNIGAQKFYTKYGFSVLDESLMNDSEGVILMIEV